MRRPWHFSGLWAGNRPRMVTLTPKRPPHVSDIRRRTQNRCHVAEETCIFLFLRVPHGMPPVNYNGLGGPQPNTAGGFEPRETLKMHEDAASDHYKTLSLRLLSVVLSTTPLRTSFPLFTPQIPQHPTITWKILLSLPCLGEVTR